MEIRWLGEVELTFNPSFYRSPVRISQRSQAEAAGFTPDLVLADHGISGVSTRLCERPEGRRLFDVLREGDTLVVRWTLPLPSHYGK